MTVLIRFLFLLLIFVTPGIVYCQDSGLPLWRIGASGGWGRSTASDLLLNHYKYSGSSFLNFKLHGATAKQGFRFDLAFSSARLYPENVPDVYYDYNYADRSMAELTISYLYVIAKYGKRIQVSVGGCNASTFSVMDEFHRNLLYPYGPGHRKSYVTSPITLTPLVSLDYTSGNNTLNAVLGYALANVSVRPDDNYVKQIGIDNGKNWKIYFPDKFSGFRYSLRYGYAYRRLAATISYEVLYNSIKGVGGFRSLQSMLLAGVIISR